MPHPFPTRPSSYRQAPAPINSIVVYKGVDPVCAAPDGQTWIAPPASSWLATAGTGDILAGMCAAQLAAVGDPVTAACNAVWLHAEVARRAGPALVADDLIGHIPAALAQCL